MTDEDEDVRTPAGDGLKEQAAAAAKALRDIAARIVEQHSARGMGASAEAAQDILHHLAAIDRCIADID